MRALVGTLLAVALLAGQAAAQGPTPSPAGPTCDDQLREARVASNLSTLSQIRERGEVARELAQFMKQIEALQTQVAAMKAALEAAKPKPAPK